MPTIDSDNPMRQIREIFSKARRIPPGSDREDFLKDACGDTEFREEVEALLNPVETP